MAGLSLALSMFAAPALAGNVINLATTGASGSAITISNAAPTQLLKSNPSRYGWTIFCAGTAGAIAVMVMPGDSAGTAASPAPSQTAGFPLLANTMITNQDFPLRGLDAIHQRLDAEAVGGAPVSCYSWEEQ
jgi:hypothetical protein